MNPTVILSSIDSTPHPWHDHEGHKNHSCPCNEIQPHINRILRATAFLTITGKGYVSTKIPQHALNQYIKEGKGCSPLHEKWKRLEQRVARAYYTTIGADLRKTMPIWKLPQPEFENFARVMGVNNANIRIYSTSFKMRRLAVKYQVKPSSSKNLIVKSRFLAQAAKGQGHCEVDAELSNLFETDEIFKAEWKWVQENKDSLLWLDRESSSRGVTRSRDKERTPDYRPTQRPRIQSSTTENEVAAEILAAMADMPPNQ